MAEQTSIEWTESSWNPIIALRDLPSGADPDRMPDPPIRRGWACVKVSAGCDNCYAETLNKRLGTGLRYAAQEMKNVRVQLVEGGQSGIDWPLRAKKPRRIFVCSMTDLFGEWVPDKMIDQVFAVMALCPQHTFQVLTKRAKRMRDYIAWNGLHRTRRGAIQNQLDFRSIKPRTVIDAWPLPNVWCGVSVEDQKIADERIPHLLQTPASIRWVSYEPALGPVDFSRYAFNRRREIACLKIGPMALNADQADATVSQSLSWMVVGGESGRGSRPFDIQWARDTIRQCREADVACFVKQLGARPVYQCATRWMSRFGARADEPTHFAAPVPLKHPKGGAILEWPADLRVREYPV